MDIAGILVGYNNNGGTMAVYEQAEGGVASAFLLSLARALGSFAVMSIVAAPLILGEVLGYVVTTQLDDPEGAAIRANLPETESGPGVVLTVDG